MKIIVFNGDHSRRPNLVAWAFSDDAVLTVTSDHIEVTDGSRHEIIGDMNSGNALVFENVVLPENFVPGRYMFIRERFVEVTGWVHPRIRINASKLEHLTASEIIEAAATLGINLVEA